MSHTIHPAISRRSLLTGAAGVAAATLLPRFAPAQSTSVREFRLTAAPARRPLVGKPHPETAVWCYDGQVPAVQLIIKNARAQGIYVGSRADYLRMGEFIAARGIEPVIDRVFEFKDYGRALEHMDRLGHVMKVSA